MALLINSGSLWLSKRLRKAAQTRDEQPGEKQFQDK